MLQIIQNGTKWPKIVQIGKIFSNMLQYGQKIFQKISKFVGHN